MIKSRGLSVITSLEVPNRIKSCCNVSLSQWVHFFCSFSNTFFQKSWTCTQSQKRWFIVYVSTSQKLQSEESVSLHRVKYFWVGMIRCNILDWNHCSWGSAEVLKHLLYMCFQLRFWNSEFHFSVAVGKDLSSWNLAVTILLPALMQAHTSLAYNLLSSLTSFR